MSHSDSCRTLAREISCFAPASQLDRGVRRHAIAGYVSDVEIRQSRGSSRQGRRFVDPSHGRCRKGGQLGARSPHPHRADTQLTPNPIYFHQLPELATRFLAHPAPVVLPYAIKVDQDFNLHSKCYDIPLEIDDPGKSKLSTIVASFEGEEGKEVAKLEDKVTELAYFARDTKQKRDFLEAFACVGNPLQMTRAEADCRTSPSEFIQQWLATQARDLDTMLGYSIGPAGNGSSVTEEDLRRSDLFSLPWVDEAITVHEASRMEMERRR